MKKGYLVAILILTTGLMTGCYENKNTDIASVKAQPEMIQGRAMTAMAVEVDEVISLGENFVEALKVDDYQKIKDLSGLNELPLVSLEDVKNYIEGNSEFNKLKTNNIISITKDDYNNSRLIIETSDSSQIYLNIYQIEDVSYINLNEVMLKEWTLKIHKGITVMIDGIDVSNYRDSNNEEILKIPNVLLNSKKEVSLYSEYGKQTSTIIDVTATIPEDYSIVLPVTDEIDEKLNDWYLNAINSIIMTSVNDDFEGFLRYFDLESFKQEELEELFEAVKETHKNMNSKVVELKPILNSNGKKIDSIIVNNNGEFRLTHYLNFSWTVYENEKDMQLIDQVLIKKSGDEFVITNIYMEGNSLKTLNEFLHESL